MLSAHCCHVGSSKAWQLVPHQGTSPCCKFKDLLPFYAILKQHIMSPFPPSPKAVHSLPLFINRNKFSDILWASHAIFLHLAAVVALRRSKQKHQKLFALNSKGFEFNAFWLQNQRHIRSPLIYKSVDYIPLANFMLKYQIYMGWSALLVGTLPIVFSCD